MEVPRRRGTRSASSRAHKDPSEHQHHHHEADASEVDYAFYGTGNRNARPSSSRTPLSVSPSSSRESLVQKQQARPRPLKVVIIGPESVGKTSLRQTYFCNRFQHNYKATIGADFEAKVVELRGKQWSTSAAAGKAKAPESPSRKVLLSVWDTAGQERFRALGSAFYRGADAVIICFDASATSEEQVNRSIEDWWKNFRDKSTLTHQQLEGFCWVAVGCKSDLRSDGAVTRRRVRKTLDKLVHRKGGMPMEEGLQTTETTQGDEPPAAPEEVLSREGIHEEDDRELGLTSDGSALSLPNGSADDRDSNDLTPRAENTQYDIPSTGASQSEQRESEQSSSTPPHSASPARAIEAAQSRNPALVAFPSRSSPVNEFGPRTPPSSSNATRGGGNKGSLMVNGRDRFDSNMSMASSSQFSVYHTPRNSQFFGSTPTGTTAGKRRHPQQQPQPGQQHSDGLSQSLVSSVSVDTIGGGRGVRTPMLGDNLPKTNGANCTAADDDDVVTDKTPQQALGTAGGVDGDASTTVRRARALSSASEQSIASSRAPGDATSQHDGAGPTRKSFFAPPPSATVGFSLFYTSALQGTNVQAVFEHIVSRCTRKWDQDDFHSAKEVHRRRVAELEQLRKDSNRKSIWNTLRMRKHSQRQREVDDYLHGFGAGRTGAGASASGDIDLLMRQEEEYRRILEETRRMVRVSDGKGDDAQRTLGGCC